ncbi:MAG: superoxide dismutase [Saprospiraceae bacterium]|nr:superoxide dismutase [Saprospiraceae bacterium]
MKNLLFLILLMTLTQAHSQYPYKLPELKYGYADLEPFIDSTTMYIHYNKHHSGYINNLNNAIKNSVDTAKSIFELFANISKYSDAVRNNAGGFYNHSLFWTILTPEKNTQADQFLQEDIQKTFGSMDSLKKLLNKAASSRFGSGWAWLYITADNKLAVGSSPNQDNPLMDASPIKGIPILGIDVWEHAYYLKYQNRRGDYLSAIWNVINWNEVTRRYHEVIPKPKGKFDDWKEILNFHELLSTSFHSAEKGNFAIIKSQSSKLSSAAQALASSKIPNAFKSPQITSILKSLASEAKTLDKLVKKKSSDKKIMKALNSTHEFFHKIVEECK